ncbi:MAG: hypothetical protein LBH00_12180 [Planctomycetaceae bacterium]|nr:hypothetical protein [Planctomycetaceae bacterium]
MYSVPVIVWVSCAVAADDTNTSAVRVSALHKTAVWEKIVLLMVFNPFWIKVKTPAYRHWYTGVRGEGFGFCRQAIFLLSSGHSPALSISVL